jgi:hypothetical protein
MGSAFPGEIQNLTAALEELEGRQNVDANVAQLEQSLSILCSESNLETFLTLDSG